MMIVPPFPNGYWKDTTTFACELASAVSVNFGLALRCVTRPLPSPPPLPRRLVIENDRVILVPVIVPVTE